MIRLPQNLKKLKRFLRDIMFFFKKNKRFILYEYNSYEEYQCIQQKYNIKKIKKVWADEETLNRVRQVVLNNFPDKNPIRGLCHGTRNGFEQAYLNGLDKAFSVVGTEISNTALEYEDTIQWDFHLEKPEWENKFDFVFSNSLDQSWNPKVALQTWLRQLNIDGALILEHTVDQSPVSASKMDPFGVAADALPYVLVSWFGEQITISYTVAKKSNNNLDAWLFVIKKRVLSIQSIGDVIW